LVSVSLLAGCPKPPNGQDGGTDAGALPAPEVASITPTRGPLAGATAVTVNGANFEDGAKVLFGASEATQVLLVNKRKLTAKSPAAAAGPVNVTVVNPDGQSASLPNGFTYEATPSTTIDEALVQNALTADDASGVSPVLVTVTADVAVTGVTPGAGQGAGVKAQVGWTAALVATTPQASVWTWADAAYTADADGATPGDLARDRYAAQVSLAGATGAETKVYSLAARFSVDNGVTWTFADKDGAANGIAAGQVPKVTVTRPLIEWCKLGGEAPNAPPVVNLKVGQPGVVFYSQVFKTGVTNQTGAGAGLAGQIGYGTPGTDPAGWTWSTANYNKDTSGGANDEFMATLPNPGTAGTYSFAFRYSVSAGPYAYCDADGSAFTADQAGTLVVTALTIDKCVLQFPSTQDTRVGLPVPIYGRVWAAGVTDATGAGAGITGEVGYGPPGVTPSDATWAWTAATFNVDADLGAADEYLGTFTGPAPGTYEYAFRFSAQGGPKVYCDLDNSLNGYQTAQGGVMVSKAVGIDSCTLQGPATLGALPGGATVPVLGRVRGMGLTDKPDAGLGVTAEVGYGAPGSPPQTGWNWSPATFDSKQETGAADQYAKALAAPGALGNYDVAYRFKFGSGAYVYCDRDGSANGYQAAQASTLTVAAAAISSCKLQWVNPSLVESGAKAIAFGRVLVPGVTEAPDAGAGIRGQVGVGNGNAAADAGFGWKEAAYFGDPGTGEDEYSVEFQPAYTGSREVSFRFSVNDGGSWTYCDQTGGSGGSYNPAQQWGLAVTVPTDFDWCNLHWPPTLDGGLVNVYGRAKKTGLTPDAGAAITAWLGYGKKAEDPGLAWTWKPAAFSGVQSDFSNEYVAAFPTLDAGTYSYAYRFQNGVAPNYCYGDRDATGPGAATGHQGFNGEDGLNENLGVATFGP
jgi:hypothetical protein